MKKLRLLLFLLSIPFLASATITFTFYSPKANVQNNGHLSIDVAVSSTYSLDTVQAIVGDRSVLLTVSDGSAVNGQAGRYIGNLDATGLPDGPTTLTIYARDGLGNKQTANLVFILNNPPKVTVFAPANNSGFITSKIHIKASVSDPGQPNCAGTVALGARQINFTNSIDTTVDIMPNKSTSTGIDVNGGPFDKLIFSAYDSFQSVAIGVPIFIDKSVFLQPFYSGAGQVIDFKDTRILVLDKGTDTIPHLKIVNTTNGSIEIINLGTGLNSKSFKSGILIDGGAALNLNYLTNPSNNHIYAWKNGLLHSISNDFNLLTGKLVANGNYLAWCAASVLYITDLTTFANTTVGYTNGSYDLASDGTIIYTKYGDYGGIIKYTLSTGTTQTMVDILGQVYSPTFIDKNNILYGVGDGSTHIKNEVADTIISYTNSEGYITSDGYAAFIKQDEQGSEQVWVRSPANGYKQRSRGYYGSVPQAMADKGRLIFKQLSFPATRYYADSTTSFTAVQSSLGTLYAVNKDFYVAMGNSVFKFDLSPVKLKNRITSFNPTVAGEGNTVTIKGGNFTGATAVTFGGVPATSYQIISDSVITAVVARAGATGDVAVKTTLSTVSLPGFNFVLVPVINSFSPANGGQSTDVTIKGRNFSKGGATVQFGGLYSFNVRVISDSVIIALPNVRGASGDITIDTYTGTGSKSGFTFVPAPIVTASGPTTALITDSLTLSTPPVAGYAYVWKDSNYQVVGTGPSLLIKKSGRYWVEVNYPNGIGVTFSAPTTVQITLLKGVITSFSPTKALKGATVTIRGQNFINSAPTGVTFGGVAASSFHVVSDSVLTAVVGTGASGAVGLITQKATAPLDGFIFYSKPVITGITPAFGTEGTSVTISGSNFIDATAVSFGGMDATDFTVTGPGTITARVSANGASGIVKVTAPGGSGSISGFTFVARPVITSSGPTTALSTNPPTLKISGLPGYSYIWKNGADVVGTGTSVLANRSGSYTVTAVFNGVTSESLPVAVDITFTLSPDNFKLTNVSAGCKGSASGSVNITAQQNLDYIATVVNSSGVVTTYSFKTSIDIRDLSADTYSVCITVTGQPAYQQCFTSVITEPKDLSVFTAVIPATRQLTVSLDGAGSYNITLNGVTTTTTQGQVTLPLKSGINTLTVSTDRSCQGVYTKTIELGNGITLFPNPFTSEVNIDLGSDVIKNATIRIYDTFNRAIYSKQYANQAGIVRIDLSKLLPGGYVVEVIADGKQNSHKIIKN